MGRPAAPSSPNSGPSSSQQLPRAKIIRRRIVFKSAQTRGRRLSNRWMALNILPQDPACPDPAQVAFLTPKRIGSAVMRNRVRRRMREVFRRNLTFPDPSFCLIWIARLPVLELDFAALRQCMTELTERAVRR